MPYAGVQNDESLFASPLYIPAEREFRINVFHHDIPLMLMSYLGTLKTLLYAPILAIFGSNLWSLRLPVALAGALAVGLFFWLASRTLSPPIAILASLLLATDPLFLLTNTFDWGPVALEHLLLLSACVLLIDFIDSAAPGFILSPADTPSLSGRTPGIVDWKLAGAFFCLGLALWNKAIFLWALSGLAAGGLAVFLPEIRRHATFRNVRVATAGFLLGALPFVVYNIRRTNRTFSENAHVDMASFPGKWTQLKIGLNGTALFGYLVNEEWSPSPKSPATLLERASVALRDRIGERRENYFYYVAGALLLAAPWWWRRRAARFSVVFVTVTWLSMAATKDAGGSAHHVVLLWPFPILLAAVALDSLPWRKLAISAVIIMILLNLSVVNQYLAQFVRNGAAGSFTDAIFPLSKVLAESGQPVNVIDWGVYDTFVFLNQRRLLPRVMYDPFIAESPTPKQIEQIRAVFSNADSLIVTHAPDQEQFPQVGAHLDRAADALGYRKEVWRTIEDSNGRPVFEILRFHPAGPPNP